MIVLGCSPAGFEQERQARAVMAPITQAEANALGGECVGVVASVGNVEYRYAQIKAKLYLCDIDGDSPGKLWGVDSVTGAPVDLAQVRADDDAGYMQQGRLQSDLRALLESSSADARHTVDLWLRADLDDAADDKDDATAQAAATQALSSSLRPAADAVLAQVAKLPSVSVKSDKSTFEHLPIPIVTIEGSAQDILAIADGPLISHVSPALDQLRDDELFSENYIQSTYINSISGLLGLDGTGITIGNLEGASPDSWANLVPSGPCTSTKCACVHGKTGPHSRTTQGVMRNSVTVWQGSARDASVLAANFDADASPPCSFTDAVNWAKQRGVNVLSRSAHCDCAESPCAFPGRLLDYVATVSPYPFVACASGNARSVQDGGDGEGSDEILRAAIYNGVGVTGAEPDTPSRALLTRYVPGQTQNRVGGANGWELPSIAAPSRSLDTAGPNPGQIEVVSATSASTPVVAGIAASMMELNPAMKTRPEGLIPGLMVSADENVDDDLGGVWPMNLHDGRDDHDGAGVVNAVGAYWVLRPQAKMNGGNTAVEYGHDFGGISSAGLPQGQWYGEIYNASVPAGATLRAGLMLMAKVTCGSPATQTNCSPQTHPFAWLAFTRNGSAVSGSANSFNNIQFAGYKNTSGSTETIQLKFMVLDWNGISSTTYWGIAWTSEGTSN